MNAGSRLIKSKIRVAIRTPSPPPTKTRYSVHLGSLNFIVKKTGEDTLCSIKYQLSIVSDTAPEPFHFRLPDPTPAL